MLYFHYKEYKKVYMSSNFSLQIIPFVLIFLLTYFLLKLFIKNSYKFGLIDEPNERSSHSSSVPRGAGIVFGFVFLVSVFLFGFLHVGNMAYFYTFVSFIIVYITGIYDDIKDVSSKKKFLFIIIASLIAYLDGFHISSLGTYFGYELNLGYLTLPFTIFAIVGFTNALNLTDGLDGLAGSISIAMLLGLLYIGINHDDNILIYLPLFLISSLLAFLVLNWHPAKVFMGDSGSLFLGFTIALLSIYALNYINPVSILFLAAIPMLDTLIVMRRRKQRGQSLFEADKNHLHHILLSVKKDHLFTVTSLLKIQLIFGLIFIQVYDKSDLINLMLFSVSFMVFFKLFDPRGMYRRKEKKSKKRKKETLQ